MKRFCYSQTISYILCVLLLTILTPAARADQLPVNLGSTSNFAVLAGFAVTNVPASAITGDIGLSPASESFIAGFSQTDWTGYATSPQVTGKIYAADMASPTGDNLTQAKGDLTIAYNDAAGRTPIPTGPFLNPGSGDLAGLTLVAGLYKFTSDAAATTDFTLTGSASDVWIFQIASALTVSNGVHVILAGGAQPSNIFWQVGTSAEIGTTSVFQGTILADASITMKTGATLNGRALAFSGTVALDSNMIVVPPTDTPVDTPTDTVTNTPTNTPTQTPTPEATREMGYIILDIYGGVHLLGTAIDLLPNPDLSNEYFPYFAGSIRDATGNIVGWSAWETAADVEFLSDLTTRRELTSHGIVWTIAKGKPSKEDWTLSDFSTASGKYVKLKSTESGEGFYLLDKFGFVQTTGDANPLLGGQITGVPLSGNRKGETSEKGLLLRAVDIEVNAAEDTIFLLDSFGGVYIKGALADQRGLLSRVYFGWDIARDLEFFTANEMDCILDGLGGVHPVGGELLPPEFSGAMKDTVKLPYFGWDIARDIEFTPDFQSAWVLDGYGPAHIAGRAPYVSGLWFGWDCAIDLEIYLGRPQPTPTPDIRY